MSELAGRPELRRLWEAASRRLEQTGGQLDGVRAVVTEPSPDERRAVDRLLGTRSRGRALRVPLDRLDALLRERAGTSLAEVVVVSCGPLRDRPGERAAANDADRRLWAEADRHPATGRHPELGGWFDRLRVTGRLRRLDDPTRRLGEALDVLEHLPAPEPLGRARLAATVLGDSHALDDAAPVGRLVVSALAHLAGAADGPLGAGDRRRLWAQQGVSLDETSSTVLTLGLRPLVEGPLTDAAARWAGAGVALPLPLAAISAERWRVTPGTLVSVCENATVLEAAAARLGPACPPLVCVEGNPSLAARLLVASLAEGGANLRYHGDFGAGGLAIGNIVIGELGAAPWRFDTVAHAGALATAGSADRPCRPLAGRVPPARWDDRLAPAIEHAGVEVEEEHVLQDLLADLTPPQDRSGLPA
ncbi:MAG: TIGR02679 family protein [Actinomycetota bacterium]|nr:TIGR02679 family protein [Actinomycetota bacterium]